MTIAMNRFDYTGTIAGVAVDGEPQKGIVVCQHGVPHDDHYQRRDMPLGVYPAGGHGEHKAAWFQGLGDKPLMRDWRKLVIISDDERRQTANILGVESIPDGGMYEQLILAGDEIPPLWELPIGTMISIFDDMDRQVCMADITMHNTPCSITAKHMHQVTGSTLTRSEFKQRWVEKGSRWRGVCADILSPGEPEVSRRIVPGYRVGIVLPEQHATLATLERQAIMVALRQEGGNVTQTAKVLDIGRSSLYRKLRVYGLR